MKTSITNLNRYFKCCAVLFFILIISNSCRKALQHENVNSTENILSDHNIELQKLKDAYSQTSNTSKVTLSSNKGNFPSLIKDIAPDWDNFYLRDYQNGYKIVEFTVNNDYTVVLPNISTAAQKKNYFSKTTLVFLLNKDTIKSCFFMKTIENRNQTGYKSILKDQHYLATPADFSGQILYFTVDRQFINGYQFKNGKLNYTINISAEPSTNQVKTVLNSLKSEQLQITCSSELYDVVVITSSNGQVTSVVPTGQQITITTCSSYDDGTGSGGSPTVGGSGGSGGASPAPPSPCNIPPTSVMSVNGHVIVNVLAPGDGGGTTNPTNPVPCPPNENTYTITNKTKNECIHSMVDIAISKKVSTQVNSLIQSVFAGNSQPALTFDDTTPLPNGIAGNTDGFHSSYAAGGELLSAQIHLNQTVLQNASREYIAAIILHESLHAYLDVTNRGNSGLSHEDIARNYFNQIKTSLKQMFPNLSDQDASALSWSGLEGTLGYGRDVVNAGLQSLYTSINANYRKGLSGISCVSY